MATTPQEWYTPFVPYLFGATVTAILGGIKMWADVRDLRKSSDKLEITHTAAIEAMKVDFAGKILEVKQDLHAQALELKAQDNDIRSLGTDLKGIQVDVKWIREALGKLTA